MNQRDFERIKARFLESIQGTILTRAQAEILGREIAVRTYPFEAFLQTDYGHIRQ